MDAVPISRRDALQRLGALAAGLAVGCTPLRVVLHDYPDEFRGTPRVEDVLRAFVTTVLPGALGNDPHLIAAFYDQALPFARYREFFASSFCERSRRVFRTSSFERLDLRQRTRVVQDGLRADGTTRKLYNGAVFLAQISVYAGIYDDERGSPLIDFEGRSRGRSLEEITYPETER